MRREGAWFSIGSVVLLLAVASCGSEQVEDEELGAFCGDGTVQPGEECDGDDLDGMTCERLGHYGGTLSCTEACTFDVSECAGHCGDGVAREEHGEECDGEDLLGKSCADLGYYEGDLSCTEGCAIDVSDCSGYCGDGVAHVDHGEECDGDDLAGKTCADLGYYEGELACGEDCALDVSGCHGTCGDGVVQSEHGEVCDDGVNDGVYGCMPDCSGPAPNYCGDGVAHVDHGEECDGEDLAGKTCADLGYYGEGEYTGVLGCASDCAFDVSMCQGGHCGDDVINGPEECDGEDLGGMTCADFGYYGGALACGEDCSFDPSGCHGRCGDGIVQADHGEVCDDGVNDGVYGCLPDCSGPAPSYCGDGVVHAEYGEECDGDDLAGTTCEALGFDEGELGCDPECGFDTSGCMSWSCGDLLVDSRDEKQYETVEIGDLCWMARNLNVGARVPTSNTQSDPDVIQKYCLNNDPDMCLEYGGHYRWTQAMDYSTEVGARGICPEGWWLPSDEDWKDLEMALGMTRAEADQDQWRGAPVGERLKAGGDSGFEALLAGRIVGTNPTLFGRFGYFWTSTQSQGQNPWRRCLVAPGTDYDEDSVGRWDTWDGWVALSVRCVTSLGE